MKKLMAKKADDEDYDEDIDNEDFDELDEIDKLSESESDKVSIKVKSINISDSDSDESDNSLNVKKLTKKIKLDDSDTESIKKSKSKKKSKNNDDEDNEDDDLDVDDYDSSYIDDEDYEIEEFEKLIEIVEDKKRVNDEDRISKPVMTKYEYNRCLSERINLLNRGAPPTVNINSIDVRRIAYEELINKTMPFIIKRNMPSGKYELWKIAELTIRDNGYPF
jgi:DNA-directed RNA polymerase I, II, and III subunit RPABC2